MSAEHHNKKPMTPAREMTLRWHAFVEAVQEQEIDLAATLSKADPEFLQKPPKHLQKSKSATVEIYNAEPFPVAFAWLWDQVSSQYPTIENPVVQRLLVRAAKLDTSANLEHLVQHFESKGMDPLGTIHQGADGGGRLLHIALQNGKLSTADWILTHRPDLLEARDLNGHNPSEFLQARLANVKGPDSIFPGDSSDELAASRNFLEIWSRKRAALDALDELSPATKKVIP